MSRHGPRPPSREPRGPDQREREPHDAEDRAARAEQLALSFGVRDRGVSATTVQRR